VHRRGTFGLTARELDVVSTIVAGCTNDAISEELSISVKTVKNHLTSIYEKLGVRSRTEAAVRGAAFIDQGTEDGNSEPNAG